MTQPGNHLRGAALVAAAALLWSSSGLFIKVLPLGPLQIAGARSLVAALVIAAAVHWRGGKPFPRPTGLDLACAAAYAAMLILFVAATKLTTAANAIFLQFSAPVYLVFLEPWATRRALQGRDLLAVALCMGAMACFFGGRLEAGTLEAMLNPVWVFIGMGERPSPWALVGGFLILGTIAWYTLVQGPKRRPALP